MNFSQSIYNIGLLFLLLSHQASGQPATALFEYLSTEDGLPQNHVFHVTQDTDGFMWFSTMGGLSKYDGFTFTNYYHREGDSTTLSSSYVNAFYQDHSGRCWVVTPNGFNRWDRRTGTARRYYHNPLDTNSLGHNHTRAVLEDKDGFLWIAHQKGLDRFDPMTQEFRHYYHDQFSVARHSGALAMNQHGEIWALGVNGIFKIDREKDTLLFIKGLPPSAKFPPHYGRELHIDSHDRIWMAYKNGFAQYIPKINEYEVFNTGPFALGVIKILEYDANTLAIAAGRGGLILWDIESQKIRNRYTHSPFDELSIRGPSIYTMYIDKVNNIWLGLFYGISVTNLETERFKFIRHATGFANYANFILRVYKDPKGGIWSNTMAGLYYQRDMNAQATEFIQLPWFPQGYKSIIAMTGDAQGHVFFGFKEIGLFQFSYDNGRLIQLDDGKKFNVSDLHFLHSDNITEKYLWICTADGLCRWDKETKDTVHYHPASLHPALSSNGVTRITQDANGNIYFINSGKICRFNTTHSTLDTLPCTFPIERSIHGIDISGDRLWFGSSEALYRYDLSSAQCRKITAPNGLQIGSIGLSVDASGTAWAIEGNHVNRIKGDSVWQFNSPTSFVYGIGAEASDGQLLFGGDKGIILIQPDAFYSDTTHPDIVFCGIDVANKKKKLPLEAEYVDEIELSHTDKVFTLHYASLHFIHRQGLTYKYQLTGFDKDWVDAGATRSVTYTNLPHGKYTFRVIAITEDQLASKESLQVAITIRPPFYNTKYFYSLIAILACGLGYLVYALRRRTSNLKKQKLLAEQRTAYKSMFLANMSHEIRTPLNAITGLNSLLLQTPLTHKQSEYAQAISASCDNLLWIVNDILDQSKIESGTYSINPKPFDLTAILHQLEVLFRHVAVEKNLTLTFSQVGDLLSSLVGDPVRLIQILSNLLNNAIKFTDEGSISLVTEHRSLDDKNVQCTFKVTDTGIGIPTDKVSAIFESFQQVNEKVIAGNQGTGLGLSIVKFLVDKMGGTIQLDSTHGKGSEFTVTLPFQLSEASAPGTSHVNAPVLLKSGLRILLVEDAPLNQLVATELIKKWVVEPEIDLAENGAAAIEKVKQKEYDVVLMDVKMPVMDGLEATRRIRNLEGDYFKILPIAGLTANVIPQQIEECLLAGMNAFIAKPIRKEDFLEKLSTLLTP